MTNALSIDLEEYFHPSELGIPPDTGRWCAMPSRVERQTQEVLALLNRHSVSATFFVLGWVAERHPGLVLQIRSAGHEIACHSYAHRLIYNLTPASFREDTKRAVAAIAEACGSRPTAYRAPSYSITDRSFWALEILVECGFTRDSSIYPIAHDRYGISGFNRFAHTLRTPSGTIYEIPMATTRLNKRRVAPVAGGGYLRLLPYRYTAAGLRRLNLQEQQSGCCYFHPWEIDPDVPRLTKSRISHWRTYCGISGMRAKLERLLEDFQFSTLSAVFPLRPGDPSAFDAPSEPPRLATENRVQPRYA
jgi:polysaccharide deacetylase family protein (PEP-CTERM system associated)